MSGKNRSSSDNSIMQLRTCMRFECEKWPKWPAFATLANQCHGLILLLLLFTVIIVRGAELTRQQQQLSNVTSSLFDNQQQQRAPPNHRPAAAPASAATWNAPLANASAASILRALGAPQAQVFKYSNNLTRSLAPRAGDDQQQQQQYHTIEINGSALMDPFLSEPMASSESKQAAVFSYVQSPAGLAASFHANRNWRNQSASGARPTAPPSASVGANERQNDENNNNKRLASFMRSLAESADNNKLLLLNLPPASTTARPNLSQRSRKFLQTMRSKRKLAAAAAAAASSTRPPVPPPLPDLGAPAGALARPADKSEPVNLTGSASQKHEKWINFDALASGDEEEEAEAVGTSAGEQARVASRPEVAHSSQKLAAAPPPPPSSEANELLSIEKQSTTTRHEEQEPVSRSKSVKSTTTIDGGAGNRRVVIRHEPATSGGGSSNRLPARLRQKIIEQFIRNGGDPQNIIVSDSTITTTSQAKKKTITTVYKVVPSSPASKPEWPASNALGAGHLQGQTKSLMFDDDDDEEDDEKDGDHDLERLRQGGKQRGKQAAAPQRAAKVRVFKNPKAIKPKRRLKKIMVTRIEVPRTGGDGSEKLTRDADKFSRPQLEGDGEQKSELGEFYTGPHASIFGLNQNPNKFSRAQKKAILELDEMVRGDKTALAMKAPAEHEEGEGHSHKLIDSNDATSSLFGSKEGEFRGFERQSNEQQQAGKLEVAQKERVEVKRAPLKAKASESGDGGGGGESDADKDRGSDDTGSSEPASKKRSQSEGSTRSRHRQAIDKAVAKAAKTSGQTRSGGGGGKDETNDSLQRRPKASQGSVASLAQKSSSSAEERAPSLKAPQTSEEAGEKLDEAPPADDEEQQQAEAEPASSTTTTTTRRPASGRRRANQPSRVKAPGDSLDQLKQAVASRGRQAGSSTASTTTTTSTSTTTSTTAAPAERRDEPRQPGKSLKKVASSKTKTSRGQPSGGGSRPSTPAPGRTGSASFKSVEATGGEQAVEGRKSAPAPPASGGFLPSSAPSRRPQASARMATSTTPSPPAPSAATNTTTLQAAERGHSQSPPPPPRTHNIMMLIDFDAPYSNPPPAPHSAQNAHPFLPLIQTGASQHWRPVEAVAQPEVAVNGPLLKSAAGNRLEMVQQQQQQRQQALGARQQAHTVSVSIFNNLAEQQRSRAAPAQQLPASDQLAQQMFAEQQAIEQQQQQQQQQRALAFEQSQQVRLEEEPQRLQLRAREPITAHDLGDLGDFDDFASSNQFDQNAGAAAASVGTPLNNYITNFTHQMPTLPAASFRGPPPPRRQNELQAVPFLFASSSAGRNAAAAGAGPRHSYQQAASGMGGQLLAAGPAPRQQQQQQRRPFLQPGGLLAGESAQTNQMIQRVIDEISKSALANGYQVENQVPRGHELGGAIERQAAAGGGEEADD